MANTCGLFGDLVPNIYIDRVFLEESHVGTQQDNDGNFISFLQTPTITVQLKVLDSISDGGTFSILGDALEIQSKNKTIDFKKYFKINCILFTSQEAADSFILEFENKNYTNTSGYFNLSQQGYDTAWFESTSTQLSEQALSDFKNTYANEDGITEIIGSYQFKLAQDSLISYLRVFTFVELDTVALEKDLDVSLPDSFKNIIGRYRDEVVIQNSQTVAQLTIFTTEDGDIWDDSFHVHRENTFSPNPIRIYMEGRLHTPDIPHGVLSKGSTTVFNVQDFRIRDEIDAFVANLNIVNSTQNTFPEQSDILNQAISKKTYFSELFITKDSERNARYHFAFDYGAYVLENIKFSAIAMSMSEEGKRKIIDNSEILNLTVSRTQVQQEPYRNSLGSPLQNRVASDGTIKTPLVGGSLGGENLNEVSIILSEQPDTADSIIRHFTGLDELMSDTEDGVFQYSVDVEINDGFVPVMREVLANLSNAVASYNNYVALANIPGVYDEQSRKFTNTAANPSSVILNGEVLATMTGQEIMESFDISANEAGTDSLIDIINTYLDTLDLFVDIDTQITNAFGGITVRDALDVSIRRNISPTVGSVDGIILFQDMINELLAKVNDVLSVGSNSVGVEATTTNRQADSVSSFKATTIKTSEIFENTIDARFLNESYINNIGANFGTFNGLNIYTGDNLAEASPVAVTPESLVLSTQEKLANNNITFESIPKQIAASPQEVLSSTKFLGAGSGGAIGNLNTQNLSPADLEVVSFGDIISPPEQGIAAFDTQSPAGEILSRDELQTEVDVLVGFTVRGVVNVAEYQQTFANTYMIKGATFKSMKIGELVSPTSGRFYLCKQTRRSDMEVVDSFFLMPPVSVTFETGQQLSSAGVDLSEPTGTLLEELGQSTSPLGAELSTEGVSQIEQVDTARAQSIQRAVSNLATRGY